MGEERATSRSREHPDGSFAEPERVSTGDQKYKEWFYPEDPEEFELENFLTLLARRATEIEENILWLVPVDSLRNAMRTFAEAAEDSDQPATRRARELAIQAYVPPSHADPALERIVFENLLDALHHSRISQHAIKRKQPYRAFLHLQWAHGHQAVARDIRDYYQSGLQVPADWVPWIKSQLGQSAGKATKQSMRAQSVKPLIKNLWDEHVVGRRRFRTDTAFIEHVRSNIKDAPSARWLWVWVKEWRTESDAFTARHAVQEQREVPE